MKHVLLALALALAVAAPAFARMIDRIVAVIDDEVITLSELEDAMGPILQQIEAIPDPVLQAQQRDKQMRAALDDLVGARLVLLEASRRKLTVTAVEIADYIDTIKQQRQWNDERLELYLAGQGLSLARFQKETREQLLRRKVIWRVLGDRIRVSEGDLREFHKETLSRANTEYEIEAAHILLRVAPGAVQLDIDAARQQANEIYARAAQGESFEELARRYSDGPSAANGGELGPVKKGTLDPEFEKILFELAPGQVGGPVQTRFGFHVVRALQRRALPTPSFEDVKERLMRELQEKRRIEELEKWVIELKAKAFIEVRL